VGLCACTWESAAHDHGNITIMTPATKRSAKPAKSIGKLKAVAAGEFKTHCLKLMDKVRDRHCEIVITKRGKPVAKLVPYEDKRPDIFGYMKGTVVIHGDIMEPIGDIWEADV